LMTDWEVRRQIVAFGKKLYDQNLVAATDGNISVRMKADKIIMTPGGHCLGTLDFNHMVHLNSRGETTSGDLTPSSELPLHVGIYYERPDVHAIIHAHPPIATAFTLTGEKFMIETLPEAILLFGEIPVAPYATPSTKESADSIRGLVKDHDAVLLDHHGAVTVGETLSDAYCRMEKLEQIAYTLFCAKQIGNVIPLSESNLKKLEELKAQIKYRS
jgi:L-fuculose-phosphate aldolase